jgi:hypothetical protein
METHVRVVGILHIVFGVLGILGAFFLMLVFGGAAGIVGATGNEDAHVAVPILGAVGSLLGCLVLAVSLPGLIAGIGVLQFREWARILMIVVSVLDLLNVPLGTALGVYGLWTLLHREAIALFRPPPREAGA